MAEEEDWELTPESAHPAAREILADDFFWDPVDDNSPFGNDTGADVLAMFPDRRREHPESAPLVFLTELLQGWEVVDAHWEAISPEEVGALLQEDEFSFTHRDDAIVALAFALLALEGRVAAEVRDRALVALQREALPAALERWRPEVQQERQARLKRMEGILRGL